MSSNTSSSEDEVATNSFPLTFGTVGKIVMVENPVTSSRAKATGRGGGEVMSESRGESSGSKNKIPVIFPYFKENPS